MFCPYNLIIADRCIRDRHVSHWVCIALVLSTALMLLKNKELLYIGGYVARAVYEVELQGECRHGKRNVRC